MISEPLATKHGLQPGDTLEVFTEVDGYVDFTIAAVFRDYGSSHGKLLMARGIFDQLWTDPGISSLGIVLDDDAIEKNVIDAIRQQLSSAEQPLVIQSNTAIHQQSLAIFDRTFEVTRVLRWSTVGVAFVGIFSALLALPLGWLMSEVLIKVINVRPFGWSMQSMMPVGSIPETFSLAILSAILAGLYPAYRLSRRGIAAQLRED